MLDLIRAAPLIALLVTTIGSSSLAGGVAWFGRGFIFDTFEKPALIAAQGEIWKAQVEAAAARATQQAQDRYYQIGEALWRQQARKAAEDDAEHQAQIVQIREEAMDYVGQRNAEGHDLRLDQRDVDFIGRMWGLGGATEGGPEGGRG